MIEIPLNRGWSKKFSMAELREWIRQQVILPDNWIFIWNVTNWATDNTFKNNLNGSDEDITATISFRDPNDAIAFRLRFGV